MLTERVNGEVHLLDVPRCLEQLEHDQEFVEGPDSMMEPYVRAKKRRDMMVINDTSVPK